MSFVLQPWQFFLIGLAGWINGHQQQIIEYLITENQVLKEQLRGKRLRLTDNQRRRLAAKGKILGRRVLARIATIVTPDTILRWHHRLIKMKWTYPIKRVGRPGIMKMIRELIVRMASDNSSWGYCRIQGELRKLDHRVAPSTIAKTLKEHGIRPAPERPTTWQTFLKSHADVIAGADFFTTEVWTARGLVTHYVLFVIHHATRTVHIAGITTHPDSAFMAQVARNLTDYVDGFLRDKRYLILDRDGKYTAQFRRILKDADVKTVLTSFQAPNMNALAERWVLSVKSKCLDRMILFGTASLERAIRSYVTHYHVHRPHQGIGNVLINGDVHVGDGKVVIHEQLGGLLKHYDRSVA